MYTMFDWIFFSFMSFVINIYIINCLNVMDNNVSYKCIGILIEYIIITNI